MNSLSRVSRRLARLSFLCLFAGIAPVAAHATDLLAWRDAQSMHDLVEQLETWLDANTDLPRRGDTPSIMFTNPVSAAAMGGTRHSAGDSTLRGLYDPEDQTVWLVQPWDARNPYDVSALLHELVHHRQAEAGHWYCPGAQELRAYREQRAWLEEMGLEPNVNWIAVVIESGCTPRDIHPD